ncbi:hypothetical protein RRG08_051414 [Elysia crispata]|uniref:Uncharacterized protein n=1 Tax=Elysia crispata TaxID=231223 RepID=A0AAE1E9B5_9GAST|nr:hypothetical protein RRG08_051414 [Elysia crispata]
MKTIKGVRPPTRKRIDSVGSIPGLSPLFRQSDPPLTWKLCQTQTKNSHFPETLLTGLRVVSGAAANQPLTAGRYKKTEERGSKKKNVARHGSIFSGKKKQAVQ